MVDAIRKKRDSAAHPTEDLLCAWLDAAEPGERLEGSVAKIGGSQR